MSSIDRLYIIILLNAKKVRRSAADLVRLCSLCLGFPLPLLLLALADIVAALTGCARPVWASAAVGMSVCLRLLPWLLGLAGRLCGGAVAAFGAAFGSLCYIAYL